MRIKATNFKRVYFAVLGLVLLTGCVAVTNQPRPVAGTWKIKYDPQGVGFAEQWFQPGRDFSNWRPATVPGLWDSADYRGWVWYAVQVKAPRPAEGYRLALVFEGIRDSARVWLDGWFLGGRGSHGNRFAFEVTSFVKPDTSQWLVVAVHNAAGSGGITGAVEWRPFVRWREILRSATASKLAPAVPAWAREAVIYEIFLRQYSPGTFAGVQADLPRLQKLGVDVLWFMPLQPSGRVRAKGSLGSPYAIRDYTAVDSAYGTLEDFRQLVQAAHAAGLRVIIDLVANHTAWDNPLIEQHPEWYRHDAQGNIVSPNEDWTDVAQLDYSQPGLRQYMLSVLKWWLEKTDIDGFRCDVAELVPLDFWQKAKEFCQQIKPEVLFLAEGARPELHLNGHDLTYDWRWRSTLLDVVQGRRPVSSLVGVLRSEDLQYPRGAIRLRFTENHDEPRTVMLLGDKNKALTAWTCSALLPGAVLLYAGQEIGADHRPDLFEHDPVDWATGDTTLSARYARIIALKHSVSTGAPFKIVLADDRKGILAYSRGDIVAFFNFSDEPFTFRLKGLRKILAGNLELAGPDSLVLQPASFGVVQ